MISAADTETEIVDAWHIALATNDIDGKVKRFWNDLGIGPWQYITIGLPERAVRYGGAFIALGVEAALAQIGFLAIGYDKPLTGPSPFDEILSKRGGGAHHLAFIVKDYERATQRMHRCGHTEIATFDGIGPKRDGAGSYFGTVEDLGTVIEFSRLPSEMPETEKIFPAGDAMKRTSNITVRSAVHVAIAVRDAEKIAHNYEAALGIGPWHIKTFSAPANYRGRQVDYAIKVAVATAGTYTLALEQPLSDEGPLRDFLSANGQGIQHICLEVDDLDRASKEMRRLGYDEMFSCRGFGPNKDGACAYYDTERTLGIVIELAKVPAGDLFA